MVKDPDSIYQPGRRGLGWLKLKKALATLDCVVVGVEWGHGKRRGVLSDYTFAVRETDEPDARLLTIGKAYTGLTDAEIATMTEHFTVDHAQGLRPLPDRGPGGRGRDRVRSDHALRRGTGQDSPCASRASSASATTSRRPRSTRWRPSRRSSASRPPGRILLATGARGETERIAAAGEAPDAG